MTPETPKLSPLKQALLAIEELQARLAKNQHQEDDAIAVVGMACRFPEGADLDSFWNTLATGKDAVTEILKERWNTEALYDSDPDAPGKMSTKWAGLIQGIDRFDPDFFGISPREARGMDPQQRLLLEASWEALENAGCTPQSLQATRTGVFVGMNGCEYAEPAYRSGNPERFDAYFASGTAHSVAAGRISYFLGIHGPNLAIDTACSSSLVAVHYACQSLRTQECRVAIAAGVNAVLSPNVTTALSKSHMMASDGRCKTFDSRADGFVRGEGCGVLVFKRLRDAQADGNRILAVIRGSAVNQDGRSSGLTAPNGAAQQAVIQLALAAAKADPRDISYIEAHGTGTALGDPIEAHALANVFANRTQPLVVGSVKTNIGHLEAAAGVAGLIKVILSLQHEWIPAHLHWKQMNPHIDWNGLPVEIPVQGKAWPRSQTPRLAGISSFGFSGTNAHVIVEEAPLAAPPPASDRDWHVLAISAKTEPALEALSRAYQDSLQHQDISSVCFTAGAGRTHFEERIAVVGRTTQELRENLVAGHISRGRHRRESPKIAFLFSDQQPDSANRHPLVQALATGDSRHRVITPTPAQRDEAVQEVQNQGFHVVDLTADLSSKDLADALAHLYASGVDFLWHNLYPLPIHPLSLPSYPFQRQRFWISDHEPVPLLGPGIRIAGVPESEMWSAHLGTDTHPFLADHVVQGRIIVPMTMFLELMLQASGDASLTSISIQEPLPLLPFETVHIQMIRRGSTLELYSLGETSKLHASATVGRSEEKVAPELETLQRRLFQRIDTNQFYENACQRGIAFGPAFQSITELQGEGREALGLISTSNPLGPGSDRYRFHPALFDACLQVLGATVERKSTLFMPVAADQVIVHRAAKGDLYSYATHRGEESSGTISCDVIVYAADGTLVAEVRGLVMRPAPAESSALARECLYDVQWVLAPLPDISSVDLSSLASKFGAKIAATLHEHGADTYRTLRPELDRACAFAIYEALSSLVWPPLGARATTHEWMQRWGVADRNLNLLGRFLEILAEDGVMTKEGQHWIVQSRPDAPPRSFGELARQFPEFSNEIGFAQRCAPHLAHILTGVTSPVQVLFPNGSMKEAEALYSESASAAAYNSIVRDAVVNIAGQRERRDRLRILEVGAGTGGTTIKLASALDPETTEYTFTDLSPAFVAKARERFAAYPFLRYDTLDLEQYPSKQGFASGQFDIILATNCLHATADLGQSLTHIREMLAPGGVLVLTEITRPERWVDLSFGLTEGWWRFTDRERRPNYPLLTPAHWVDALVEHGFDPATPIVSPDADAAIFLAAKNGHVSGPWLVVGNAQGIAEEFVSVLATQGQEYVLLNSGDLKPEIFARKWYGIVILSALDATPSEVLSTSSIDAQDLVCRIALDVVQRLPSPPSQFVLATRGAQAVQAGDHLSPEQSPLWGFARSLAEERPEFRCQIVDLDPRETAKRCAERLLNEIANKSSQEAAWRGGERYSIRLGRHTPAIPVRVSVSTRGSLDNVEIAAARRKSPGPGQVEIAVAASGVNFRDVFDVMDLGAGATVPSGGECAGSIVAVGSDVQEWKVGDEVIALAQGAHDGFVLADARLLARKPEALSHEQAAGLAIPFLTARYALDHLAKMKPGERVLIHAAAGGVGLAAVQLAMRAGVEVFATAGNDRKREYLRSLGVQHVFNSRSTDFAAQIAKVTGGYGVDIVLNSLANEAMDASFQVIAAGGRFLEIGKRGVWSPEQVAALRKSITYFVVDWGEVALNDPALIGGMLRALAAKAGCNEITPLPTRIWNATDAKHAFRYLAQARHIGKIVLRQPGGHITVRNHEPYLITGGFGGLGIESAKWLFARGARDLILIGRSVPGENAAEEITKLRDAGAHVQEVVGDIASFESMRSAIDWRSVRGVIHCAGTLADGILAQMDWEQFRQPLRAKIDGSLVVHHLTAEASLDFFLLFSSIASITGGAGQANHAAANSFEDALAYARRAQGLPAISIDWGAWSELGAAVRDPDLERRRSRLGLKTMTVKEGFQLLDEIVRSNPPQAVAARVDWNSYATQSHRAAEWLSEVRNNERNPAPFEASPSNKLVQGSAGPTNIESVRHLVNQMALRILEFPADRHIEPLQPLQELGLDSLMSVEFRNVLAASLGQPLPSTLLFNCPAVEDIVQYISREVLKLVPTESMAIKETSTQELVGKIEGLSDDEVDRLFAKRMTSHQ